MHHLIKIEAQQGVLFLEINAKNKAEQIRFSFLIWKPTFLSIVFFQMVEGLSRDVVIQNFIIKPIQIHASVFRRSLRDFAHFVFTLINADERTLQESNKSRLKIFLPKLGKLSP